MRFKIWLSLVFVVLANARPSVKTCGYDNCPKYNPNGLNIHLVAHTHDDVGWVKTVDGYYNDAVKYILDTAIEELVKNPERRFIYVEMAFFWKWWQHQEETVQNQVKQLVKEGRLEFTGGAWSMNDEATTNYQSTIDQTTWGFRKLDELFGECGRPTVGWQIDPFGHSREEASLFSQFGYDGLLFSRIDYRDKEDRMNKKTAELLWDSSPNLGLSSEIFTSILYDLYQPPRGFCFDKYCGDEQIYDDKNSEFYNAEERAKDFLSFVEEKAKGYKSNNILITMGGDFHFENATKNFVNIDKLIKAVNDLGTTSRVFYSTPACYVYAVNQANLTWPTKTDDFFSYASHDNFYWTGFYTSRPTLKRFERVGNNFLQIAKQLTSLTVPEGNVEKLDPLREAMGVLQHHDGVSGTEKQAVADDYAKMLHEGLITAGEATSDALLKFFPKDSNLKFESCLLSNISQCALTESNDKFVVTVYNPLSRLVSQYIRLPVNNEEYKVFNTDGYELQIQYVPIFSRISNIPGRDSKATKELVFRAENIPPLGFKTFYVENAEMNKERKKRSIENDDGYDIDDSYDNGGFDNYGYDNDKRHSTLFIEERSGAPEKGSIDVDLDFDGHLISVIVNDKEYPLKQNFLYYKAGRSGAYAFEPTGEVKINDSVTIDWYAGPIVEEIHQQFNDWIGQVIRVYKKENYIEFNWVVGPIPIEDRVGKEVIVQFVSDLHTDGVFYTDTNGREMIKRIRDKRSNFDVLYEDTDTITRNFFPVTSKITLKDEKKNVELNILNDRSQGGGSIRDGEIELLIHRRILHDDGLGVDEPLNEIAFGTGLVATGKHFLVVGDNSNSDGFNVAEQSKLLAEQIQLAPWTFISTVDDNFSKSNIAYVKFSGLKKALPKNVHILTLEPWQPNTLLLRLEHIFEKNEDPKLSKPVTVNLKDLFSTFEIEEMKELSLGANQLASKVEKLKWVSENPLPSEELRKTDHLETFEITLNPIEIKTFSIKIKKGKTM